MAGSSKMRSTWITRGKGTLTCSPTGQACAAALRELFGNALAVPGRCVSWLAL